MSIRIATQEHRKGIRASLYWLLLIVGLFAVVARQWQINALLGRENQRLQEQLRAFEDTKSENAELQSERDKLRRFQDSELQQIQVLRAEVHQLRQRTNEADRTRLVQKRALKDAEAISAFLAGEFQSHVPSRERTQPEAERAQADEVAKSYLRSTRIGGWLGLSNIRDMRAEDYNPYRRTGVFIAAVAPGGPAEKAKLQGGDLVFGMDGQAIAGVSDLKRILAGKSAGQAVALEVARLDGLGQEIVARIDVVVSDWPQ